MPARRIPAPLVAFVAIALLGPVVARSTERGENGAGPRFDDGVSAVFRRRCVRCHGHEDSNAGLRLDSYTAVMRGGDQGPAVVGGDRANSLLYQKVIRRNRPAMPPRSKLSTRDIVLIRAWIDGGALP